MIDLLCITNDPVLAARYDRLAGMRLFVDLERNGKAERQAGRNTFISTHRIDDVGRVKAVLTNSRLMVRLNPIDLGGLSDARAEINDVIAQGADLIMLPMFTRAAELIACANIVDGRVPLVPLLETSGALESIDAWVETPGIHEVYVGLNDLHLSLGCRFMFEPLVMGHVERVAHTAHRAGVRFGFGGIARAHEGLLPGRAVLGEHVRLGSQAVILSRTFNRRVEAGAGDTEPGFEAAVEELRDVERELESRSAPAVERDRIRVEALIRHIAESMGQPG